MTAPPFDWSQYLALAEELSKRSDEPALRSALSRAYYYVYHLGLKRAEANGYKYSPKGGGSHKQLWSTFKQSTEADCRKLGEIAARLKEKRVRADYQDRYTRISEDIPMMLEQAKDFEARLVKLDSSHPRIP